MRLRVHDLEGMTQFYELAIGLRALERSHDRVVLGAGDGEPLVELLHRSAADPRPDGTTGLFHLALLVSGRAQLAAAIRRVTEAGWSFTGASDHLVSEAVYLRDPEGNGIEIYRDRLPEEWDWDDGAVRMATLPLDVPAVMTDLPDAATPQMAGDTVLGHVHLNVADIGATEDFYAGALGFDVTTRGYPGALFLSAGGYHHHIGSNTWEGPGAPPPPAGALGLDAFEVVLPDAAALDQALARLTNAGLTTLDDEAGIPRRRSVSESPHPADVGSALQRCQMQPTATPTSDRAEAVGAIIRRRRQALGLTLRGFARQCEISPAHLSKIERGLASPSMAMLTRIVQELDLHGADLFGLAVQEEKSARVVRAAEAPIFALDAGNDPDGEVRVAARTPVATVLLSSGGPGHRMPQRTSDRQVIVIVLEGAVEAQVGDELIRLGEGDTLIVPPGTPHGLRVTGGAPTRTVYISSEEGEIAFEPPEPTA